MIYAESALSASCGQTDFLAAGYSLELGLGLSRSDYVVAKRKGEMQLNESRVDTAFATRVLSEIRLDAANPAAEWRSAEPVRFSADWQGKNADPTLETEVRILWSPDALYLRFVCHYHDLSVFEDSDPNGRRDYLWDRDVAEAFLQPAEFVAGGEESRVSTGEDARRSKIVSGEKDWDARRSSSDYVNVEKDFDAPYGYYKEFEVAPNGMWIDLDIIPGGRGDLKSGLSRSVHVDKEAKIWTAELAIPMKALTSDFNPNTAWRVNFYRVEGKAEPRKYLAWQPTMAPQPNYHMPEKFGILRFH